MGLETEERLERSGRPGKRVRRLKSLARGLAVIDALLLILCGLLVVRNIRVNRENDALKSRYESMQIAAGQTGDGSADISGDSVMAAASVPMTGISSNEAMLSEIRSYAEQGKTFLFTLKQLFPQQFVLADEGRFHFVDIDPNLRPYTYDNSMISLSSDGIISYEDEGVATSYGIDVSQHNGIVDWDTLNGIEGKPDFVFVRAGIRGYGSGKLVADEQVSANLIGAKRIGAETGVYFVTQAVNEEEAREEARFVLDIIKDHEVDMPIVLDVEKVENYDTEPRTKQLTAQEYSANLLAFADEMSKNGRETMIYGNGKTFMLMLDMKMLDGMGIWFADYVSEDDYIPYFPYDFKIWQFTSEGNVPGVTGYCDLNIRFD
ncbi:MAG: hypothetical protein IJ827_00290 [Lachnospiraceae bacterium]|nr:hypothetical protein [Lachnospiraceae bacterium]